MVLSGYVRRTFDWDATRMPNRNQYRDAYAALLDSLIHPHRSPFFVTRDLSPHRPKRDNGDWVMWYYVRDSANLDVLFVLACSPAWYLDSPATRAFADAYMRKQLSDLGPKCPLPVMRGISAMGTKIAFYSKYPQQDVVLDDEPSKPHLLSVGDKLSEPQSLPAGGMPPVNQWSCDVLGADAERRIRQVMKEIYASKGWKPLPQFESVEDWPWYRYWGSYVRDLILGYGVPVALIVISLCYLLQCAFKSRCG